MRLKILIYGFLAGLCLLLAIYFFAWAANNFLEGLTWEAVALSIILTIAGLSFIVAAYNNSKKLR